jgi:hypothetical protein
MFVGLDSSSNAYITAYGGQSFFGKYNSAGTLVWSRSLDANAYWGDNDLAGNTYATYNTTNPQFHKLDSSAAWVWSRQIGDSTSSSLTAFTADKTNGGCYHAATDSNVSLPYLQRTDASGNASWRRTCSSPWQTKALSTFGNFVYWLLENPSGTNPNLLIKLDTSGNVIWQRTFSNAYLTMNQGYFTKFHSDLNAVYLNFNQTASSGSYNWQHCFKYPADGSVTGSWTLGWSVAIAAGSATIASRTPTIYTTTNPGGAVTSADSTHAEVISTVSTTPTIIKVP